MKATLWALGILVVLLWVGFVYGMYWAERQGHNYGGFLPVLVDGGMAIILTIVWFILLVVFLLLE